MNLSDALRAVRSGKADGFKCSNDTRYIIVKQNIMHWADTDAPINAAVNVDFFLYENFELVHNIPEGWKRNTNGQVVRTTSCERWVNVYFDRSTEEYIERDHREEAKAIREATQMGNGSIVFLRRIHAVNQYTLQFEDVYGVSQSKFTLNKGN